MNAPRRAPATFELAAQGTGLPSYRGARILVTFVVNIEHWSLDKPMPRAVLPAPHGMSVVPDVANHSWVLYGLRAGLPRVVQALSPIGDRVSVALNSEAIAEYPEAVALVEQQGWEMLGHGVRQESIQSVADEAAAISVAIGQFADRFGVAPRGWLSPGMNQTDETLRLQRECGIEFTHDWMIDDRPVWLNTGAAPMLGLPYTVENNDVTVFQVQNQPGGELLGRVERTLDRLSKECVHGTVVLPIGLHPHIMGVPHRIAELESIVNLIVETPLCRAVTSSELADWYSAEVPV